jgi:hypothetical protein
MKDNLTLTITSLLTIVLASFHIADDVVRGFEPGGFKNYIAIAILVVWLTATLVLAGRRSGYITLLVISLLGALIPAAHMRGAGMVGGRMVGSGGRFFFVWTLLAIGVTSIFSVILSARGLWKLRANRSR